MLMGRHDYDLLITVERGFQHGEGVRVRMVMMHQRRRGYGFRSARAKQGKGC